MRARQRQDDQYLAQLPGGLIQQVAVCYLREGYVHYAQYRIRKKSDPLNVDREILENYPDVLASKDQRYRNKKQDKASLRYIRWQRYYVLMATKGDHPFKSREAPLIRDASRGEPIQFYGHSLSVRGGRVQVRIGESAFRAEKTFFEEVATKWTTERLRRELLQLPYERYRPVLRQLYSLVRLVNDRRKRAGVRGRLREDCIPCRRRIYRPFEEPQPSPRLGQGELIVR